MSFWSRWLGGGDREERGPTWAGTAGRVPTGDGRLTIDEFSEHFVRIAELDFYGQWALSPSGRFRLVWRDGNDEGTRGGYRTSGPGQVLLLEDDRLITRVRAERPNDCRVADNGSFIVNDWRFGDGLKGRFLAFRADGSRILAHDLGANLFNNGLAGDGRLAVCQTAHAPGDDGCRLLLFDLTSGTLLSAWHPEQGSARSYGFDPQGEWVELRYDDKSALRYGPDGIMLDREGWLQDRISRGDVHIIEQVLKDRGDQLTEAEAANLIAGLEVAIAGDHWQFQARGARFKGEILERMGRNAEALAAYEEALLLDPQVGARRRADRLRRELSPDGAGATAARRLGRFERHAEKLGIDHEKIELLTSGPKQWRHGTQPAFCAVEEAALAHYEAEGWTGAASEGGLILTLLKAASFEALSERNADTFIEALYAQNVAFEMDRFDSDAMIETVLRAPLRQIELNWRIISASAGDTPAFYPRVKWSHVKGLHEHLGMERLAEIARIFATAPYDFRAGWPDLTLWREGEVRFVEVKAPGDQLHASQSRLISRLLVPLGFRVGIAEIVAAPAAG